MKLRDLLSKNSILIDLKAADKADCITQMTTYLCSIHNLGNPEKTIAKVLERESEMSTGIGFGIAIPHARLPQIDRAYLVAGRCATELNFDAIDESPVRLVFLLVSPTNTATEHTMILSSLSRIMVYEDIRQSLCAAATADAFLQILIAAEDKYVE